VGALAGELLRAAHVDQLSLPAEVGAHVVDEGADGRVVALGGDVLGRREARPLLGHRPTVLLPARAPAVHDAQVGEAEEPEHPEGVRRPPVVLVAVEDDRVRRVDPEAPHERLELRPVDVVADGVVVEVGVPVDLLRPGRWPRS
jgi:hypothetical protein